MLKGPIEAMQVDSKTLHLDFLKMLHRRNHSCYLFAKQIDPRQGRCDGVIESHNCAIAPFGASVQKFASLTRRPAPLEPATARAKLAIAPSI